jgi:Fe-S cluster assembly ATP-binding protein
MIIISHQERILSIADEIALIQDGTVGIHGSRSTIYPLICKTDCDDCDSCFVREKGEEI